jgi:acyl-coenzyme A synthetase/AMP-(fatty) acid ligase
MDETLLTALESDVDGSDPLAIIYTSGSTAAPKGVVHTHAALLAHQENLNAIRGLTADDALFCNSPFFWIGGFAFALLATLVAGSTLVCSNATDAGQTLDLLETERPTMTTVSSQASLIWPATPASPPAICRRCAGATSTRSWRRKYAPADPELRHNMLGMTEAGVSCCSAATNPTNPNHRRGSFGSPAPGFEARLDEHGELCIRGRT